MRPAFAFVLCAVLASLIPAAFAEPAPCVSPYPRVAVCDSDRDGRHDEVLYDSDVPQANVSLHANVSANASQPAWNATGSVLVPRQGAAYVESHRVPGKWGNNTTLDAGAFTYSTSPAGVNGFDLQHECRADPKVRDEECPTSRSHLGVASSRAGESQGVTAQRTPGVTILCTFGTVQRGCERVPDDWLP